MGAGLDDPPEARLLEHRRQPDVAEAHVDSSAVRVDRIGLDPRCSGLPSVVDDASYAAIGRRVILQSSDEEPIGYEIVLPGSGDPSVGWISADSPLGDAILGAQPGDVVDVDAPGGRWSVTVVAVS